VQLSRALARRGHELLHVFSADFPTPKGSLVRRPDDPEGFATYGISFDKPFDKQRLLQRRAQDISYAARVCAAIKRMKPDVVVGCNNPLDAQCRIQAASHECGSRFIFWLQDIHSLAITNILQRKLGFAGRAVGAWYTHIERSTLRSSDAVVSISPQFLQTLRQWSINVDRTHVIPNWAPLDEIDVGAKQNDWSTLHGLHDKKVVLYTGTLGFKHNPRVLIDLALRLERRCDTRIVVVSEQQGADYLKQEADRLRLSNLVLLPFQPMSKYSEVLASADVLVALIEPDAATYSVPSKVLSYLCSGRPIVLSVARDNLAAATLRESGAGILVEPGDFEAFAVAVEEFLDNPSLAQSASKAARDYAEAHFDIELITTQFEKLFSSQPAGVPARLANSLLHLRQGAS
jgi:glycosyltransferase involved in cell wall biosynthesis